MCTAGKCFTPRIADAGESATTAGWRQLVRKNGAASLTKCTITVLRRNASTHSMGASVVRPPTRDLWQSFGQ